MIAVFIDRDGVINEDVDFLHKMKDLAWIPGSLEAIARLAAELPEQRAKLVVISNQSVVGRGMCTLDHLKAFCKQYFEALERDSEGKARIDDFFYCPHHPTAGVDPYRVECECRKPKPGMLLDAQKRYGIDLGNSFMIGDRRSDILAGQAAGCFSILVETGWGGKGGTGFEVAPDAVCRDLSDAVDLVLERIGAGEST